MPLPYRLYDVFTQTKLAGNPLAVVDARDQSLSGAQMQRIAQEFNLSETVFLLPPTATIHTASLRIFTPDAELPFAGHPTVGAAVALARDSIADGISTGLVLMEEPIGLIRAAVQVSPSAAERTGGFAEFDLTTLPTQKDWAVEKADVALALGLAPADIGFENHQPTLFDGGLPYLCIPVRNLDALSRITPNAELFAELLAGADGHIGAYPYTRETLGAEHAFACRMFWNVAGAVREDPATGSAAASLAGAIMAFDAPMEGKHNLALEQGHAMGRPSLLHLELEVDASGALSLMRLAGDAVLVAEGTLFLE